MRILRIWKVSNECQADIEIGSDFVPELTPCSQPLNLTCPSRRLGMARIEHVWLWSPPVKLSILQHGRLMVMRHFDNEPPSHLWAAYFLIYVEAVEKESD